MANTFGPFNWTMGEAIWAVLIVTALVVEVLGLYRVPIPGTDATFVPLTLPVERNMERRWWVWWLVVVFLVWLAGHWTDLWPWESDTPMGGPE